MHWHGRTAPSTTRPPLDREKIERAAPEGRGPKIQTPLINLSKADIIRLGVSLGVDYALTTSCYDPTIHGVACGHCDSCLLRLKGFAEAGMRDPIRYRESKH